VSRRIGILLSGRGSNFEAIARNIAQGRLDAEIALVVSNRESAQGLATARAMGFDAECIPSKGLERDTYDQRLVEALQARRVHLVVLAGYMRLLSPRFIRAFPMRIVNIHPSLLPAFPGLDAQHQAFEYGARISGCTAHFVDEHLDHGPIILQAAVPVRPDDSADTLSARILAEEHRIYSEAIGIVLDGRFRVEGRRVILENNHAA
jgi:phosphoribosylglycinamide formyltransferase-1